MPANIRFCAVQIEVICLLLCSTDVQLCEVLILQTVYLKNEHMFESRIIHNMLHEHVLHVVSHNVMRRNILCPWTFSKFKWWVRWVKKPFSQNFVCVDRTFCRGAILLSILRCAWRNRPLLCGANFGTVFVD